MFETHLIPYREYIRICHLRWRHAACPVTRVVILHYEFRHYVDVSVRVFVCHVFLQLIANRAMVPFSYSAFHIWISTHLKLNALLFQHVLNDLFKNSNYICDVIRIPGKTFIYWSVKCIGIFFQESSLDNTRGLWSCYVLSQIREYSRDGRDHSTAL